MAKMLSRANAAQVTWESVAVTAQHARKGSTKRDRETFLALIVKSANTQAVKILTSVAVMVSLQRCSATHVR
jgi:hypothetical protein